MNSNDPADQSTPAVSYKLCLTTVDSESTACHLAQEILKQKLVACVNISSRMTSLYHWQDEICEDHEFLLMMKTSSQKVAVLETKLLSLHPYEVPEFVVIDIDAGNKKYLNWINSALS